MLAPVVVVTLIGAGAPSWPAVRMALSRDAPRLATAELERVAPGRLVLRLPTGERLDPVTYDELLASLAPLAGASVFALEVVGPDGEPLSPEPLPAEEITQLAAAWREAHPGRSAGRQVGGLEGALAGWRIALSAGHGLQYSDGAWGYQRGLVYELREDIHTNEIVMRHLAPMLERAGAEVILVRERSAYGTRVVVDNDGQGTTGSYVEQGGWLTGGAAGFGGTYRYTFVQPSGGAAAIWSFSPAAAAEVPLYVWYQAGTNRSGAALFQVVHATGRAEVTVDQRTASSRWNLLGTFPWSPAGPAEVRLTNLGAEAGAVVIADAVRLAGGLGFADFGGGPSGQARWRQGAAAYAREEGVPTSVIGSTGDVTVRPALALWQGVDLYVSLHTNAGGGRGTSSFVYSSAVAYPSFDPNRATPLPPGTLALQEAIHNELLATYRQLWEPTWVDRGLWGADFGELRPIARAWQDDSSVAVPAVLLELAFHDDAADTSFLREDRFRRDSARAIYRGLLRFVHAGAPASAVIAPLPPVDVHGLARPGGVLWRWQPASDPLDPTGVQQGYEIELSSDGVVFSPPFAVVDAEWWMADLRSCDRLALRVSAVNAGGRGLPSRTVIARPIPGAPRLLWVDGERRLQRTAHDQPDGPNTAARMLGDLALVRGGALAIDTVASDHIAGGGFGLADYDVVLWSTGETSSNDGTLGPAEQQAIRDYLAGGGALILSGAEIGWDLVERGSSEDAAFFAEVLQATYVADDAETFALSAASDARWLADLPPLSFDDGSGASFRVDYPDVLAPLGGGVVELVYATGGGAAIGRQEGGRLFFAGFPLETIEEDATRRLLLDRVLEGFGVGVGTPACGQPLLPVVEEPGPDGGPADDGSEPPSQPRLTGGCGCTSGAPPVWLGLLVAARWAQRRRGSGTRSSAPWPSRSRS